MIAALGILRSKWFVAGLAGLVVVTTIFFGYRHYTGLIKDLEVLRASQAQQQMALDIQRQSVLDLSGVIEEYKDAQADLERTVTEMMGEAHEAREEARRLRRMFAEIDWEALAPADVDSVAAATIDRLWRLLESASRGSEPGPGGVPAGEADAAGAGAGRDPAGRVDDRGN